MDPELYNSLKIEKEDRTTTDERVWTLQEQSDFMDLLLKHGCKFKLIAKGIKTKSESACRKKAIKA